MFTDCFYSNSTDDIGTKSCKIPVIKKKKKKAWKVILRVIVPKNMVATAQEMSCHT